ncbi:MAG: group II intron reverse transcriptase/maturase [Candidatus Omnitrophica bacterium]|nr:group II intron reverse transcriptase/maturase [Candidatus Omnitrophota bacterium]
MLMEQVCASSNMAGALKRVQTNKGSYGVDGMHVEEVAEYLREQWPRIQHELFSGTYKPSAVRRVEIPKASGGIRKLGIPTVVDRVIQQAVLQVLQPLYDKTFSENSYGFRPGRSAHQAVLKAQEYIRAGYAYVVDIDLQSFFDKVNHDRLMSRLARRVEDKRLLKLVRAYLNAGIMENGLVKPATEGTPQGGNLSPLLSNIVLDELDKELLARGHRFVRYADDCNIYVKSKRAGERVMTGISRFITKRLKLKVNLAKSAVDILSNRKFLGYSFTKEAVPRIKIAPLALERFKRRVRELTNRNKRVSFAVLVKGLMVYVRGWMGYYRLCQTLSVLTALDSWIRRRIRCWLWKQWETLANRTAELVKRGVSKKDAHMTACKGRRLWATTRDKYVQLALPNAYLKSLGIKPLASFITV